MKRIFALILFAAFLIPAICQAGDYVRGYYRDSNGDGIKDTYVSPYQRTSPNNIRTDNYSYPGNYNPNSGRITPYSNSPARNYPTNPSPYRYKYR